MSITPIRSFRLAGCAALALATACSGPNLYRENRLALEAANEQLASGQLDAARAGLEAFLVRTNSTPREFVLQRYFGAYLLSRAALEASLHAGDRWLEPLVGASYYLNFALEWSQAAASADLASADGEPLLPAELADLGFDKAQTYLDLTWLILCARTRFQGEVAVVLGRQPGLATVPQAEELSRRLGMSDALRPWLMWSLFDFQKQRDEKLAYTFGVRARELGRKQPASFPAALNQEIVDWILHESKFVFRSSAGVEFDPGAEVCSQTGEPNITFQATPR